MGGGLIEGLSCVNFHASVFDHMINGESKLIWLGNVDQFDPSAHPPSAAQRAVAGRDFLDCVVDPLGSLRRRQALRLDTGTLLSSDKQHHLNQQSSRPCT